MCHLFLEIELMCQRISVYVILIGNNEIILLYEEIVLIYTFISSEI